MLFYPYFHITTSLSSSTRFILVSPRRGETKRRPNKNCFLALGRSSFSVKPAKHSQKKMPRKRVQVVNILPTTEAFSFCVRLLRQLQKVAFLRKTWIAGFLSQLSLISKEKCVAARSSLRLKLVFAHMNKYIYIYIIYTYLRKKTHRFLVVAAMECTSDGNGNNLAPVLEKLETWL